ncbi:MAG TPA: hypothetical protein VH593_04675 [Ktedonobacteraceae bacterium]
MFFWNFTFSVKRKGTVVLSEQNGQLEHMSLQEAIQLGGESPYDMYRLFCPLSEGDLLREDLIIDEINIDPDTETNAVYRVSGPPRTYSMPMHMEVVLNKVVGTPN